MASQEAQEQILGIIRAALDASLVPLLARQMELEARLEQLTQEEQRARTSSAMPAAAPMTLDISAAPAPTQTTSRPPMKSTAFGLVIEPAGGPRRSQIDIDLSNVGSFELPNFGNKRRTVGGVLVVLLLLVVAAVVVAMILSYS